jgi:predicted RNase H-like HicB family nuclease
MSMATMDQRLHVQVREEDESFWATVDEYPGVFAAGDDLEELRESIEEGIRLMLAGPDEDLPNLRLSRLRLDPDEMTAGADLESV